MAKKKVVKKKSKTSAVKTRNRLRNKGIIKPKKVIRKVEECDSLENKYETTHSIHKREYNTKMLLPVKTKSGIQRRFIEVPDVSQEDDADLEQHEENMDIVESVDEDQIWLNRVIEQPQFDLNEPVSMAQIFARREEAIQKYKYRIGLLSSTLLENPEMKIANLNHLLEIMDENEPELQITIKKLVILSLMEIFKDLIPAYQIKHRNESGQKLKKVTLQLFGYENQLLKSYQEFLKRLEKVAECLRKKKGDNRMIPIPEKNLGKLAVKCLCELLMEHPYFNYSENIVHLLTIYLDNVEEDVRKQVEECYRKIFNDDKRGFISLVIVRRINHLVKTRAHSVHCEPLAVLLSLRIKNVNLDQEKEDELNNKKLMQKRSKFVTMSRKEKKRKKELEKLDRQMLEAQAEENKKSKQQHLTEVVKTVFLIYFRILKRAPRSNLLSITLEGLAKFAHCINLEYYHDLVNVLDRILEQEPLNTREQLYCIKTVFIILSGQGEVLNIDPLYFYSHLYRVMFNVHVGKTEECTDTLLSTLEAILINRRKKMTTQRVLSFNKRLATIALQLSEDGVMNALKILKTNLQLTKAVDILLDVESTYGQGMYYPELNEPEFANAGSTAMWELCALRRHYHPFIRTISDHIAHGAPSSGEGSLPPHLSKITEKLQPTLPPPIKKLKKKTFNASTHLKNDFLNRCSNYLLEIPEDVEFCKIISK